MKYGALFKQKRNVRGLSLAELAKLADTDRLVIYRIENDQQEAKLILGIKLMKILNITIEDLERFENEIGKRQSGDESEGGAE